MLSTLVGSMALFAGPLHAQNLLQDGGFELGLTSGPGTDATDFSYGAWANTGFFTLCVESGMPWGGVPAYEGAEAMRMVDQGGLYQTFPTTVGKKYKISLAVNAPGGQIGTVQMVFKSSANVTNLAATFVSPGNSQWSTQNYTFVASENTTELTILNLSAGGGEAFIDDVRVEEDTVVQETNLLADSGFELRLTGGPGGYAGGTSFGAWSGLGSPNNLFLFGMPYGSVPPYEGDEAMYIGDATLAGFVSQTFQTVIGEKYRVSLALNDVTGGAGAASVTVSNSTRTDRLQEVVSPGGYAWGVANFLFLATGTTTTIKIQNVAGKYSLIDDVRVSTTPPDFALKFDGVNDYARIPGFGNQMPTTEITVEFWQRVESAKAQSTFSCNANAFNAHIPYSNGQVYWDYGGKRLQYTPPVSIVGTWQHFALVSSKANGYMLIYRNGVFEAIEATGGGTFAPGNFDLNLGNNFGGTGANYFDGELDEFRVWNGVRSQAEIAANINTRLTGNEPGLVAYFRIDEGSGTALVDATTPANNGTLFNGTEPVPSTVPVCGLATQELDLATLTTRHYSFGGYLAAGINFNLLNPASVTNIFLAVTNLCYDITPVSGATGVNLNRLLGQNLSLDYDGGVFTNRTTGNNAAGLRVRSSGQNGATGDNGTFLSDNGSDGNRGADGGTSTIDSAGAITTTGNNSVGILAISAAGNGGNGGNGDGSLVFPADGGNGNIGGNGGTATVHGNAVIATSGADSIGVLALSQAGNGGNGGEGSGSGDGGRGGIGGDAGAAEADGSWTIRTSGDRAVGIGARSLGGSGGVGRSGGWFSGDGGAGGGSGDGSTATVHLGPSGYIDTTGSEAHGIFAQSIGGFAGNGGNGDSISSSSGGGAGSAGSGGDVLVVNEGFISTRGVGANAIFAESVGGGGGTGGSGSGLFNGGAGGSSSGDHGGLVTVENLGAVETFNQFSRGIFAQSVGGSGGNGATSAGLFYSVGGAGGKGGNGATVGVYNEGSVLTAGNDSVGIFAQSIGGGGGTGGGAAAASQLGGSVAIGGSGGDGGHGASVFVESTTQGTIETLGDRSYGIFAQSVGGGGGNGGFAVSGSVGTGISMAVAVGGRGGTGGSGSNVVVTSESMITTAGVDAHGIMAQSVGGGGGSGGFSIAVSGGAVAGAISVGGKGATGGNGEEVSLTSTGDILTLNDRSYGLFAQSVGGGGGDGGFSVSAAIGAAGLSASLGGSAAGGGSGKAVILENGGHLTTEGDDAHGIVAQSVGGGGGTGGFSIAAAGGVAGSLGASLGGGGGAGGSASTVHVDNWNTIETFGEHSYGILAQSVGGGGGDGGFSIAASGGYSGPALAFSLGGNGGMGGVASAVDVINDGEIYTDGKLSHGIMAQSVGGGGGSGGFSVAAALSAQSGGLGFSMGGTGGQGNAAGVVTVDNTGLISTIGDEAAGVFAQSVGGGGGNGGASFAGSFSGTGAKNATVSLGGNGGTGGDGNRVTVSNDGNIETFGARSRGIFAQSIGGGGGNGGMSGAVNLGQASAGTGVQVAFTVGGRGGAGGTGGDVRADGSGRILTEGADSAGVFVQSIGGGGGNGGASLAANAVLEAGQVDNNDNLSLSVAVGGSGGSGNRGGTVAVNRAGLIETWGDGSHAIFAQSVGGGGGTGGSARSVNLFLQTNPNALEATNSSNKSLELSLGGFGGDGGLGGLVGVTNVGNIITRGGDAYGILAQSIGGGGGTGGDGNKGLDNLFDSVVIDGIVAAVVDQVQAENDTVSIALGGIGGTGNDGGNVVIDQTGSITTLSAGAYGVFAQSIGAGGGVGGNGVVSAEDFSVNIGGTNNAAGNGGAVTVLVDGLIDTSGAGAHGILAQSVGGGGGVAGAITLGLSSDDLFVGYNPAFGRGGGSTGAGGTVVVNSMDDIITRGTGANGIFAQSVGGGGGVAGSLNNTGSYLNFSGSVGGVGNGGVVSVAHTGNITTLGNRSHGIFAQSAGGIGVGGFVGVSVNGDIAAGGGGSDGVFAQSRGNNGNGNIQVTLVDGNVQGGSGTGVGVRLVNGANNTLNNYGTISSLSGAAVQSGNGHETVNNYGTVTGSVNLGTGNNTFNNFAGATLDLGAAGSVNVGAGRTLSNSGLLTGSGQIAGNIVNSGNLDAGNSPGRLTISGSLSLASTAGLHFDLAGTQAGITHDQIRSTSLVQFAGTLSLALDNLFVPGASESFTLMEFASRLGTFGNAEDGARLSTQDNLASFQVNYTATTLEVSAFESPDTDGDGMTDYEESLAGTDRLLPQSVLACVTPTKNGSGHIVVRFARVTGKSYTIAFTHDLGGGVWTDVTSPVINYPDANTGEWIDDGTLTGGLNGGPTFYRAKLKQ